LRSCGEGQYLPIREVLSDIHDESGERNWSLAATAPFAKADTAIDATLSKNIMNVQNGSETQEALS
jgi:hypothetical protein